MCSLVSACQQVAAVIIQIALHGCAVTILRLQECIGIGVAIHGGIGVQVVFQQGNLGLAVFGQGEAFGLCCIGQGINGLGGLGSLLHEVVCPGFASFLVVNLLVQRLGGVQAKQGQVAAIGVGIVIDVVDVVIVQLCVVQLMLAHGCGDGVALVDTAGLHRTADTCPNGNGNQRNKHDHKADAVELYFFCFLLLKNLTLGQLLGAFRMKLLLFGCTHEIISSHCSLLRI